jgi:hypothetical protein
MLQAHAELVTAATDHIDGPIQQKIAGISHLQNEMEMSDIRDSEVQQRSQRIASYYQAITNAFDKETEKMVEVSV